MNVRNFSKQIYTPLLIAAFLSQTGCLTSATTTANLSALVNGSNGTKSSGSTSSGTTTAGSTSPVTVTTPVTIPVVAPAANQKSVKTWAKCDGVTDDLKAMTTAMDAAKNNAFVLVVDCPLFLHIGSDIAKPIFIEDNTTVIFSGNTASITVDNIMVPAFVLANTTNATLTNWNIIFKGLIPINPDVGGYYNNGVFYTVAGSVQPAGAFNDSRMKPWLAANRNITFDGSQGWVSSIWRGGVQPQAILYFNGNTSGVKVSGLKLSVPVSAGLQSYIPMAISFGPQWKSNQTVSGNTTFTIAHAAVPHDNNFTNVNFDGTLMGFQGNLQSTVFEGITSQRYGDLEDAQGKNIGGLGKWFPPPHLFYLNYDVGMDGTLFNKNLTIHNVQDIGPRVGQARDSVALGSGSGYALSLKIGCNTCTVDTYSTVRPDGFMDVLPSNGLTISNVTATYNSAFISGLYPGWRWPASPYANLTFKNISLTDTAAVNVGLPIGRAVPPAGNVQNVNIVFNNVNVTVNAWGGTSPETLISEVQGQGANSSRNYLIKNTNTKLVGN